VTLTFDLLPLESKRNAVLELLIETICVQTLVMICEAGLELSCGQTHRR